MIITDSSYEQQNIVALSQMQAASDAANTIRDVDFNSPFDDT